MGERRRVNAFLVLGLPATASRTEVERAAQKRLGLLQVGSASGSTVETREGPHQLDLDEVREAVAALRDPHRRLVEELDLLVSAVPVPELDPTPALDLWRALAWDGPTRARG
jgi:hypothetical protein